MDSSSPPIQDTVIPRDFRLIGSSLSDSVDVTGILKPSRRADVQYILDRPKTAPRHSSVFPNAEGRFNCRSNTLGVLAFAFIHRHVIIHSVALTQLDRSVKAESSRKPNFPRFLTMPYRTHWRWEVLPCWPPGHWMIDRHDVRQLEASL